MEKLPQHKILQFHYDTFEYVRRDVGLDKPGQMDAAIDLLDDWIKKQTHFTKTDFSREYLERSIILVKGSVERAKVQIDKLCTMKTSMSDFFIRTDARNDFGNMHDYFVSVLLPKMTKEHYRLCIAKAMKPGLTTHLIRLIYEYASMLLQHIKGNDYCSGFIVILDYRALNVMESIAQLNIMDLQQFIQLLMEGYQMRIKGIHIITPSNAIDIFVRILKQIFSKKIGDRIKVHKTVDSLHECVPKHLLPKEFDGEQQSIVDLSDEWIGLLTEKENIEFTKELYNAKVNESLRIGTNSTNEEILGISGSFKKLCVD